MLAFLWMGAQGQNAVWELVGRQAGQGMDGAAAMRPRERGQRGQSSHTVLAQL